MGTGSYQGHRVPHMMGILTRRGDFEDTRGATPREDRQDGVMLLQAKESQGCQQALLSSERGPDSVSLPTSEGTSPTKTLTLDFYLQSQETVDICRLNHPVCGDLLGRPGALIHPWHSSVPGRCSWAT